MTKGNSMEFITANTTLSKTNSSQAAVLHSKENINYSIEQINPPCFIPTEIANTTNYALNTDTEKMAKPFLKWAGGKKQLIEVIRQYYPFTQTITKYAEPFVGGGAILFDILNNFNLKQIYISDINPNLIKTYICIRDSLHELLELLKKYQNEYIPLTAESRRIYYNEKRRLFNNKTNLSDIEKASLLIFLNKTCFNGLYRVNKKGEFNVPMGTYKNPAIYDERNLYLVSQKLQNIEINCADFTNSFDFIDNQTFVYFDPPYRPLSQTASFTSYAENEFDDTAQRTLAQFIEKIDKKGAKFLLSNSDPKNLNENDMFFEDLYSNYKIKRTKAARMINCKSEARGTIDELLISNF